MKKIIKQWKIEEPIKKIIDFKCNKCWCEFVSDEWNVFESWVAYSYHIKCPTCDDICDIFEAKER